jgi:hypothetical protein
MRVSKFLALSALTAGMTFLVSVPSHAQGAGTASATTLQKQQRLSTKPVKPMAQTPPQPVRRDHRAGSGNSPQGGVKVTAGRKRPDCPAKVLGKCIGGTAGKIAKGTRDVYDKSPIGHAEAAARQTLGGGAKKKSNTRDHRTKN